MSILAQQLSRREVKVKGKPSLLYEPDAAAEVDLQTIHALAQNGKLSYGDNCDKT